MVERNENKNCSCSICQNNIPFTMPKAIIDAAINEELVLFCGAGISTESKNVIPTSFYIDILNELNYTYGKKLDTNISFSKLMSIFCDTVTNGRRELILNIKKRFDMIDSFPELHNEATKFHNVLAGIPQIQTIITTNWDTYFEDKCSASPIVDNKDVALWNTFNRRVFKIHGSINNIGSIIATDEDYDKSYEMLKNEPIGDRLKSLLTSHTVVFIGFSFGDDDLNKIIDILSNDLGDFANQYYLVTINESWKKSNKKNIIPLITDGTLFINSLKRILTNKGYILDDKMYTYAKYMDSLIVEEHLNFINHKNFKKDLINFPEIVLSVAYQDGLIHAFQRCHANKSSGMYIKPNYLKQLIHSYNQFFEKRLLENKYSQAYYDLGYLDGLIALVNFSKDPQALAPPLFTFCNQYFNKKLNLINYIKLNRNEEIFLYCQNIVNNLPSDSIPHFRPWYC